jgi:hypothetical protein
MRLARTVVTAVLSLSAAALAQPRPPAEALAACNGLSEGTACGFTRDGKNLTGTCRNGPNGEQAACMPAFRGGPGGPGPHGPPPEALAACTNQTAGAACSFSHHDRSLTGTCKAPPEGSNGALACAPEGGPRGHHGPPPEALAACASSSAGASCTVTLPDGRTLTGACVAGPNGEALACQPPRPAN